MTYDSERIVIGRSPMIALELDLDFCGNTFGSSPCTASAAAGGECYNTYNECQDTANYTKGTKIYRFLEARSDLPIGVEGYAAIVGYDLAPTVIDPTKGVSPRGTITITLQDFTHHDRDVDPYAATRTYDTNQGTFLGRLFARNPYYKKRFMRLRVGFNTKPFSWANFEDRLFVIDKVDGPDKQGRYKITGKDILKLVDDDQAQAPSPSTGTLSAAYTAGGTSLVLQTGEGADYNTDPYTGSAISGSVPGYVRIGDNVLKYTGVSTDTLTGVVGGQFGSTDEDLDIDDSVQQCLYYDAVNVVDIADHLLKQYGGIDESYIPYDAGLTTPTGTDDVWDDEKANWLNSNTLTHLITQPTGVNELLSELFPQNLVYSFWNEREQEIKIKAIAPQIKNESPLALDSDSNIIADSLTVKEDIKGRISQIWIYYDKIDVTQDNKPENFRYLYVKQDANSEGVNAYDSKSVKIIYANWLTAANSGLVITLAGRLLSRYGGQPKNIKFAIDAKDINLWTGNVATLDSNKIQSSSGANKVQKIQVIKTDEIEPGHKYVLEAQSWDFEQIRYGFIAPNTVGDYTAESEANKNAYGFICQNDGKYSDGDSSHLIA